MGMMVGYILRSKKHIKIHPVDRQRAGQLIRSVVLDRQCCWLADQLRINGDGSVLSAKIFRRHADGPRLASSVFGAEQAGLGAGALLDRRCK